MAQVPRDLIFEILIRLPVKSLLRFRSLSKSLSAVIDSPDFINSHLCNSSQNLNLHKMIFSELPEYPSSKIHICDVNLEEEILRLKNPVSYSWKKVVGNCKGLLLLSRSEFGLGLWNPSTCRFRDLPDCPLEITANVGSYSLITAGLGYDDSIDDFKVTIMVLQGNYYESGFPFQQKIEPNFEIQVWIYVLKSNIWRRAHNFPFPYLRYRMDYYIYPGSLKISYFTIDDGSLNWLFTLSSNERQKEIVAFDMRKETFSIVPQLPVLSEKVAKELHVLEGCLCISYVSCSWNKPEVNQADLYMRKKDGVDMFTWTKLFSVTGTEVEHLSFDMDIFYGVYVLGYSKREDKILLRLELDDYLIVSYDLKNKSFAKVEMDKDPKWVFPIMCLESLVSVGGGA